MLTLRMACVFSIRDLSVEFQLWIFQTLCSSVTELHQNAVAVIETEEYRGIRFNRWTGKSQKTQEGDSTGAAKTHRLG